MVGVVVDLRVVGYFLFSWWFLFIMVVGFVIVWVDLLFVWWVWI